jgi:Nitroreductase family
LDMNEPIPRSEPLPYDEFRYPVRRIDYLPEPGNTDAIDFFPALENRRSSRNYGPLLDSQLNALLWFSNRTISKAPNVGKRWEHRTSPSAGGRHPIDVLIMRKNPTLELALHNPCGHSLLTLEIESSQLFDFWRQIDQVLPLGDATLLWFAAQPNRTSSAYLNADSLIWRDSGSLLATFYFVASALNLSACAIGPTGNEFLQTIFQTVALEGVGGVAIGAAVPDIDPTAEVTTRVRARKQKPQELTGGSCP